MALETLQNILIGIMVIAAVFGLLAHLCFDDNDPDMFWYDNFSPPPSPLQRRGNQPEPNQCAHKNKRIVSIRVEATCETTQLVCNDCGEVLTEPKTDCR